MFAVTPMRLRVLATRHLWRLGNGWQVAPDGGTITFHAATSGAQPAGVGLAGRLVGNGTVRVQLRDARGWHAVSLEEPVERDGPGLFAAGPIWTAGTSPIQLRLTIKPARAGKAALALRDLRVDALARPATLPLSLPAHDLAETLATDHADQGPVPLALAPRALPSAGNPAIAVISRTAWGSPDGETSPRWIPFYEQPFHVIVHHTGEPPGPNGPIGDLQATWSFHTFTRGWGDIGYNYVIDTEGRIYEGRAGGDLVGGAHTHNFNIGSVGIALIGNYETDTPPAPMLRSLQRLITALANRHGINVQAIQYQNGESFAGLAGHRDFAQTDCPGQNVYNLLPHLRTLIAHDVHSAATPLRPATLYVTGSTPATALLKVQNTGTSTWNERFSLRRRSGPLFNLPAEYAMPQVAPGGSVTLPLFLPALPPGSSYPTSWQLFDSGGYASGPAFHVTLHVLAAGIATHTSPPHNPFTATPVPTATAIPAITGTRTSRPTATRTPHTTATGTSFPSYTPTIPLADTMTPTSTAHSTGTVVSTITPVPTSTPHASHTPTATVTPTATSTATAGPTPWLFPVPTDMPAMAAPAGSLDAHRRSIDPAREPRVSHLTAQVSPASAPTTVAGASRWYFAEGASGYFDRETIAMLNPGPRPAYVVTTLVRGDGRHVYAVSDVPPGGRATLDAGNATGTADLIGAIVQSSEPLVAERSLYHASTEIEGTGATLVTGEIAPSLRWYLPRLPVSKDERERLAILNPNATTVTVIVSAVVQNRLRPTQQVTLGPLSVQAVSLPAHVTSAVVDVLAPHSSPGVVVEERTIYSAGRGYTAAAGLTSLSAESYLPGASGGAHDYVMLLNPGTQDASVTLTGLDSSGAVVARQQLRVRGGGQGLVGLQGAMLRRTLLHLHADRPVAAAYVGFLGPSTEATLAKGYRGSVSMPPAEPARAISFAEGDTRSLLSAPREALVLSNPGASTTPVHITLLDTGGQSWARALALAAHATVRLDINALAPPGQHGLVVRAERPILALHTIDFNQGTDRMASYGLAEQ